MRNAAKTEERILGALALSCYAAALTAFGVAAYALVTLTAYFAAGQNLYAVPGL